MSENAPPTILVVDDTEASRYAVCRILRSAHYRILEAATAEAGLRLAVQQPDLIILDVGLPDMSGYEACRRLKENPLTASVAILHLSASFVDSENRSAGLEGGADGYLTYPLESRELLAQVEALLRLRWAERRAQAQEELLRVTLASIGDGVIATDQAGAVTFINRAAQNLIGCAEAEALGGSLNAVLRVIDEISNQPAALTAPAGVAPGGATEKRSALLLVAKDGTRRPIDVTTAAIHDGAGHFVGVVLVFRDVTERRLLEREMRRRSEDMAERDRRKDEFLAMLAHELRNPLAPIRNGLAIVQRKLTGDLDLERVAGIMDRQVTQMARLVDDLLDVARISLGKIELRAQPLLLAPVVAHVVETFRSKIDERRHLLELELPVEPIWLMADPARLEQVLGNLLSNAVRYTPPGGHIVLRAEAAPGATEVIVRVRDNGIGIRPEELLHLFELFTQGGRVPGQLSEGLGVGLTLVRTLVELHGGSVSASSPGPDQGSEFTVRLPRLSAAAPPAAPLPSVSIPACNGQKCASVLPATGEVAPGGLRVLITDDNVDAADSLCLLLRSLGHEVRTADDGPAALQAVLDFHPEVIFLDVGLPRGMDGYEVARRVRREPGGEGILLIALTGYGQPQDVANAHQAGMDHHLTKPVELDVLFRLLEDFQRTRSR